jgi:hypothetical protein
MAVRSASVQESLSSVVLGQGQKYRLVRRGWSRMGSLISELPALFFQHSSMNWLMNSTLLCEGTLVYYKLSNLHPQGQLVFRLTDKAEQIAPGTVLNRANVITSAAGSIAIKSRITPPPPSGYPFFFPIFCPLYGCHGIFYV